MTPVTLETPRQGVTLRELTTYEDDLAFFHAIEASRDHLRRFAPETSARYQTIDDVTQARLRHGSKLRMGIWDYETLVGSINLTPDAKGGAEIGYWVDARHTRHGYATIGTQVLSAYAAQHFDHVYATVEEGNDASIAILANAGFQEVSRRAGHIAFELASK